VLRYDPRPEFEELVRRVHRGLIEWFDRSPATGLHGQTSAEVRQEMRPIVRQLFAEQRVPLNRLEQEHLIRSVLDRFCPLEPAQTSH
jgi:hypothetical protein